MINHMNTPLCPYCGEEGKIIDNDSGECTNPDCGGYFELTPIWSLNPDWRETENEN